MKRTLLSFPKLCALLILLILIVGRVQAQNAVVIGGPTPNPSAVLMLVGNGSQGFIIPVAADHNAITKVAGMIVYNSTDKTVYACDGTSWSNLGAGSNVVGGDLTGTLPNAVVAKIRGVNVSATAPTTNQVLQFNGTNWVPATLPTPSTLPTLTAGQLITNNGTSNVAVTVSGDATFSQTGALTVANNAITSSKLANTTVTAGTYGSATQVPQFTVDAQGRLTAASNITIPTSATKLDDLSDATVATPTAGQILINDGAGQFKNVSMSGDVAITAAGVSTIQPGAISGGTAGEITDATITDADISATAAIAGTKVNPSFGAQNISTTGTISTTSTATAAAGFNAGSASQFTINNTGNITKINNIVTSFPAAQGTANTFLMNNGTGILSWATTPAAFTTANYIPKGNGTGLVASNIFDDGTNVGIGTITPAYKLHIVGETYLRPAIIGSSPYKGTSWFSIQHSSLPLNDISYSFAQHKGGYTLINTPSNAGNNFIDFRVDDVSKMIVLENGNVGVGTNVPTQTLDVAGPVQFSGALMPGSTAGTSGQILTSNGTGAAPIWKTNKVAFKVNMSAIQNLTGTATKLDFTVAQINVANAFDLTNNEFVAPVAGVYSFSWKVYFQNTGSSNYTYMNLTKNGGGTDSDVFYNNSLIFPKLTGTTLLNLAAGDKVALTVYNGAGATGYVEPSSTYTVFSGELVFEN